MDQTRRELEEEILTQYRRLGRALKVTVGSEWMELDLTIAQLRTLLLLAEEGPLFIGHIAQRMGIGLSSGGHLVDRLVQAGLAARTEDRGDRRRTLARLTPRGEDLYARLLNRAQHLQALISQLRADELTALLQALQGLNRVVEEQQGTRRHAGEERPLPHLEASHHP